MCVGNFNGSFVLNFLPSVSVKNFEKNRSQFSKDIINNVSGFFMECSVHILCAFLFLYTNLYIKCFALLKSALYIGFPEFLYCFFSTLFCVVCVLGFSVDRFILH